MDCEIPEGTWINEEVFGIRQTESETYPNDWSSANASLANYREIIDAGGDAPSVGDKIVSTINGNVFTVRDIGWEWETPARCTTEEDTFFHYFDYYRPALSNEIPQKPEYRKNKNGEYHEFPSIKVDDVNRTHDNCRCVNISYDEANGTSVSDFFLPTSDVRFDIKFTTVESEADDPIDTRITEVVKPVLSRRTWDVMAVDGMPMRKTKPFYKKTELYNNDNPDANWWKDNSFSKKAKEDAKKQWYHDMDGKC